LNLGLRYEFLGQAVNALHPENVAQQTGSDPFWSTSLPLSATTFPKVQNFWGNIEPHLGLAFTPDFDKGMIIRAAFGINAGPAFNEIFLTAASGSPVVNSGPFNCDGATVCNVGYMPCSAAGELLSTFASPSDEIPRATSLKSLKFMPLRAEELLVGALQDAPGSAKRQKLRRWR
jgi:hypothetical protein